MDLTTVQTPAIDIADELNELIQATEHIDETPSFTADSEGYQRQQEHLRDELREAYSNGDAQTAIDLRRLIEESQVRQRATEVLEARAAIENAKQQIVETNELVQEALSMRSDRQRIFAEKKRIAEDAGTAVQKIDFLIYRLENELTNYRALIRRKELDLKELINTDKED